MKMPLLDYVRASTLDEAIGTLTQHADEAKILAGGQSLIPLMSFRLAHPSVLVDVTAVPELAGVSRENGHLSIGAATRMRAVETDPAAAAAVPLLPPALAHVGHPVIRNRGTIGGTIAHADPAAELPTVLTALGGRVVVQGPQGRREIASEQFFAGPLTTDLAEDEVLTRVLFPVLPAGTRAGVEELARRHGDFAIALAVAAVHLDDAGRVDRVHVGVGGVDQVPRRLAAVEAALLGNEPTAELITEAAGQTENAIRPIDDVHASAAYRRKVARVVVARALKKAVTKAEEAPL
ncbi:Carbon-monoxide dehydrogenase (Acceptor) [Nostocoides australiense Ben110]|uniref:Carbon-monoxide dehydrogenase (Acceptor) n=1 Tax=Nostocoides australiense Ben110 TaxID=1193182 RepID=W6JZA6_9MICO|nr:xanthine dehydrogenase family protein subunit M [Tetrasphaera australiensis]CCH74512.1 Carbon-monoxide dehydrogenase (Acceptor) [Tetrasphaera australiensis Ben110]